MKFCTGKCAEQSYGPVIKHTTVSPQGIYWFYLIIFDPLQVQCIVEEPLTFLASSLFLMTSALFSCSSLARSRAILLSSFKRSSSIARLASSSALKRHERNQLTSNRFTLYCLVPQILGLFQSFSFYCGPPQLARCTVACCSNHLALASNRSNKNKQKH